MNHKTAMLLALLLAGLWGCQRSKPTQTATATTRSAATGSLADHEPAPAPAGSAAQEYEKRTILTMSTRLDLLLPQGTGVDAATEAVRAVFTRVAERANEWRPESPLAAVNDHAGGTAQPVPADLRALVKRGLRLGARTGGAFDITWAALWGLWDFRAEPPAPPPLDEVAARVALVDFRQVEVDGQAGTVRLARKGMKIGLGGIAKGWALDESAAALQRLGVRTFMLSAGGQVRVAGGRSGRPWRVGIRDPRGEAWDYFAVISVTDGNVSTSGDYERFFVHEGRRYHHILNPATGMPASGLRSATVLAPTGTDADALSTACMVMGRVKTMTMVETDPGLEVVLVDDKGKVHVSAGLADRLQVLHPPLP